MVCSGYEAGGRRNKYGGSQCLGGVLENEMFVMTKKLENELQ